MKFKSRVACIATALVMVLTMTGTGVFAADNMDPTESPVQDDQFTEVVESEGEIPAEEVEGADPEETDSLRPLHLCRNPFDRLLRQPPDPLV